MNSQPSLTPEFGELGPKRFPLPAARALASLADLIAGVLIALILAYAALSYAWAAADIASNGGTVLGPLSGTRPRHLPESLSWGPAGLAIFGPAAASFIVWMLARREESKSMAPAGVGSSAAGLVAGFAIVSYVIVSPNHAMNAIASLTGSLLVTLVVVLAARKRAKRRRTARP